METDPGFEPLGVTNPVELTVAILASVVDHVPPLGEAVNCTAASPTQALIAGAEMVGTWFIIKFTDVVQLFTE